MDPVQPSAVFNLGAHLLGRKYVPDDRDYELEDFLAVDPLQTALDAMIKNNAGSSYVRAWAKLATARILGTTPAPTPTPPKPSGDVVWADADTVLDQGQTPHCVGFGWAGWGDTDPVNDKFTNADGDKLYYECKIIDGEPNAEDGSDVRSGAKAMQARKRLSAYAFTTSIETVKTFVNTKGPVVFGTNWTEDMFNPDANGVVKPTGAIAGGHCYICVGDQASTSELIFQNSWGKSWGATGRFYMAYSDAQSLLSQQGEACAAVELA